MSINSRKLAAQILYKVVVEGGSLTKVLAAEIPKIREKNDRAFVQALCFGTLRWYFRLDFILDKLLKRPIRAKDADIRLLALLGLFQLGFTRVKAHAAVAETVQAASKKTWAKPFLNGVLRSYQRDRQRLEELAAMDPIARTAHPGWMLKKMQDWPLHRDWILEQNNQQAPMILRVNRSRLTREHYLQLLNDKGIEATAIEFCDSGLCLKLPVDVENLPGFDQGLVSVQDGAAQLAATLLDVKPGSRVLDLCAAPGGKTLHILERCPEIKELVAVDIDPVRSGRIRDNLNRTGLHATLLTEDAAAISGWWDGRLFDRILVDVPCSASGVIRRHPDIKLLRLPEDISVLEQLQQKLLESAWFMLKPGGILLYSTCSIFKQENERQISGFLASHCEAKEIPIQQDWGHQCEFGRQILPGEQNMDGFYYARLLKQ